MAVNKHFTLSVILLAAILGFSCESRDADLPTVYSSAPEQKHSAGKNSDLGRKLDVAFVSQATRDVMLEFQVSELAVKKAATPETKELAIAIMTDHSIAKDELYDIAAKNNMDLAYDLTEINRKQLSILASQDGSSFDKAYRQFIVKNNKRVIKEFEGILQNGNNDEVKDWAWGKLGIFKRHLAMAQNVDSNGSATSIDEGSFIE
jgi:putative membrane protein